MDKNELLAALKDEVREYNRIVATEKGDWIVKGFIDIYKQIYPISIDTKVVSKVIELMLLPSLQRFAERYDLTLELPPQQNFYPDLTFISRKSGDRFAVDIKSTFKGENNKIKSLTLGAFTGYFRNRESTKNTTYPYGSYSCHLVLGVVYAQNPLINQDDAVYGLDQLDEIESVIRDFEFFVQPKYKIASASPGSGNTKNIGSVNNLEKLISGNGIFSNLGEDVYDDYWMYFLTNDMAKAAEIQRPYINLKSYMEYKSRNTEILERHKQEIEQMIEEEENVSEETVSEELMKEIEDE